MKRTLIFGGLIAVAIAGYFIYQNRTAGAVPTASVTEYLSGESSDAFLRATEPNNIEFPRDLGSHPDYQTEWWYYTGNLKGEDGRSIGGRQFGYQFTIFRQALAPESELADSGSDWRTSQVWFAHFAISDIEGDEFYAVEKFSRGAAELAGAQAEPYHVWIEDWQVEEQADGRVRMTADAGEIAIDFMLTETRPPVLHGLGGLSQKGPTEGNASYYYSLIDQKTEGTIRIGDETFAVTGHSWKDHEYSTSVLEEGATGWDWVSLQFDNDAQNALMLFQIRRADGSIQPESSASWIQADGSNDYLRAADFELEITDWWTSDVTGIEYPAGWLLTIPEIGLELTGKPLMNNQEVLVSTTYWEGAVAFEGTLNGEPLTAEGYFEMTGYTAE